MTSTLKKYTILSYAILISTFSLGQRTQLVQWQFKSEPIALDEAIIKFTAEIAPAWHLYSQFIKEGGPFPTRFIFEQTDDFVPLGKPEEKGEPIKFYDDLFEMDITWYKGTVSFLQKIRLIQPFVTIRGRIEYMTCNDDLCVPDSQEFIIKVSPP